MFSNARVLVKSTLLAGALLCAGPGVHAQSLKQTFIDAYKNSNLLNQNRALLRATDETAAQALAAIRPVVAFSASATRSDPYMDDPVTASLAISASLLLYDGGDSKLEREVAKQTILSTRASLRAVEQQVLLNAASAFFSVRRAAEVVTLQTNNLSLIERELDAATDRFEVGEATRTDVALAQARLAAAKSALAAANGSLAQAREFYRVAVGKYPAGLGAAGTLPRPAASLAAAKAEARKKAPSIIGAQHDVKIADLNVKRADAGNRPSINLSGSVRRDQDFDSSASVTLSLDQTIYAGGRLASLYRQAIAQQDAARSALLQQTISVEQNVGNAWADLTVSNVSLSASEEQITASRLAFEGLREEASLGARTTLDVLDAEQDLLDAETNRAAAVNDRYIAAYTLLAQMGKLTVDQLNLGIVSYDPAAYYESIKKAPGRSDRGLKLDKLLESLGRKGQASE